MHPKFSVYVLILLLCWSNHSWSQAISWLSQPQHEMGLVANGGIKDQKLSANGRYLTFISTAGNLMPGDTNYGDDIYHKDLVSGEIKRVTELGNGQIINNTYLLDFSSASDDGRYVSFIANADNLPMANGDYILYLKDLQTGVLSADSVSVDGQTVYPVSVAIDGTLSQSADGRYVAFASVADIVNNPGLTKNVFRKDRQNNSYQLVSVTHTGDAAGTASLEDMSANGQYITFNSAGEVLPTSPNPAFTTNYLRDMNFGNTVMYHRDTNQSPVIGHYIISAVSDQGTVAFCSAADNLIANDNNALLDLFVYEGGAITRASLTSTQNEITDAGCGAYYLKRDVEISADGQYIGFLHSSNQLTAEDNLGKVQAYRLNRGTAQTVMISKNDVQEAANKDVVLLSFSSNGLRASLVSAATSLPHPAPTMIHRNIYMYNHNTGNITGVALAELPVSHWLAGAVKPLMTGDMSQVVFSTLAPNAFDENEVNDSNDLYIYDMATKTNSRVATHVLSDSHDVSDNGRYLVFVSDRFQPLSSIELGAEYVFLYDSQTDQYSQIAEGNSPKVNDSGWVVFVSEDDGLSPDDDNGFSDIYLYQSDNQSISLVTVGHDGSAANFFSSSPDIGGIGVSTWLVFLSHADNLIVDDIEGEEDVFIQNWGQGPIVRISENSLGEGQNSGGSNVAIAANTQTIVFDSFAQNLTADTHLYYSKQIYVYDRINNQLELISLNDDGFPHDGNLFSQSLSVSATGRYIGFGTVGFFGNDANENSEGGIYLYDQVTQSRQRISQFLNGDSLPGGSLHGDVQADESHNPPLVSVLFTNPGDLLDPAPNSAYDQIMLYQQGGPGVDLSMQVTGAGSVSGNLGYFCQGSCENTYDLGTTLNLLAIADQGASFLGWSGDVCLDNNISCEVIMNENKSVQALFSSNDVIFVDGFE